MSIYGIFKKNKFHPYEKLGTEPIPYEKLGTEPILSNVHPMAIRCPSDGHPMVIWCERPISGS